jgi:hypothetical protein
MTGLNEMHRCSANKAVVPHHSKTVKPTCQVQKTLECHSSSCAHGAGDMPTIHLCRSINSLWTTRLDILGGAVSCIVRSLISHNEAISGDGTSSSLGDFHVISALAQVFDGSVWLHLFWRGWTPFTDVSPSWRHTGSHQIQSTGQTMMSMKVSGSGKASGRRLQIYRTCCIDEFQSSDTIDANGIRTIVEYKTNEEGKRVKVRTPILYFTPAL